MNVNNKKSDTSKRNIKIALFLMMVILLICVGFIIWYYVFREKNKCGTQSACQGKTPYCNNNEICVECISNDSCPNGSYCNSIGTCVSCVDNSNCTNNSNICNLNTNTCMCGTNIACQGDAPYCNSSGSCVSCLNDKNCAGKIDTPYCNSTGTCVSCVNNINCTINSNICDTTTSKCMCGTYTACKDDTPYCNNNLCVECINNNHCPIGTFCNLDGNCVSCLNDSDCDVDTPYCNSTGTCVSCVNNINCTVNSNICDTTTSTCMCGTFPACKDDTPYCNNNLCVECINNNHCANGTFCNLDGSCVSCLNDSDCGQGYNCINKRCVKSCTPTCTTGYSCINEICKTGFIFGYLKTCNYVDLVSLNLLENSFDTSNIQEASMNKLGQVAYIQNIQNIQNITLNSLSPDGTKVSTPTLSNFITLTLKINDNGKIMAAGQMNPDPYAFLFDFNSLNDALIVPDTGIKGYWIAGDINNSNISILLEKKKLTSGFVVDGLAYFYDNYNLQKITGLENFVNEYETGKCVINDDNTAIFVFNHNNFDENNDITINSSMYFSTYPTNSANLIKFMDNTQIFSMAVNKNHAIIGGYTSDVNGVSHGYAAFIDLMNNMILSEIKFPSEVNVINNVSININSKCVVCGSKKSGSKKTEKLYAAMINVEDINNISEIILDNIQIGHLYACSINDENEAIVGGILNKMQYAAYIDLFTNVNIIKTTDEGVIRYVSLT